MKKIIAVAALSLFVFVSANFAADMGYGMFGSNPTVKMEVAKGITGQAGIGIVSGSGSSTITMTLVGTSKIQKAGDVDINAGAGFIYTSVAGFNSWTICSLVGFEKNLSKNLEVGFYVSPLALSSGSTLSILSSTYVAAHIYL